jgi:hypothetical protein
VPVASNALPPQQRGDGSQNVRDNFKNCKEEDFCVRTHNNNLFEIMCDALIKKKNDDASMMGALFYRRVKDQFRRPTDVMLLLTPPSPPEPVPPALLRGAIAAKWHTEIARLCKLSWMSTIRRTRRHVRYLQLGSGLEPALPATVSRLHRHSQVSCSREVQSHLSK